MIRFAHSEYLYALYLLPVLIIIFLITQRKQTKQLLDFAGSKLHKVLLPFRSSFKVILKFGMTVFAMLLIIIAIANPQIGSKIEEVKQVGIDVFILLDVSLSISEGRERRNGRALRFRCPTVACGSFTTTHTLERAPARR